MESYYQLPVLTGDPTPNLINILIESPVEKREDDHVKTDDNMSEVSQEKLDNSAKKSSLFSWFTKNEAKSNTSLKVIREDLEKPFSQKKVKVLKESSSLSEIEGNPLKKSGSLKKDKAETRKTRSNSLTLTSPFSLAKDDEQVVKKKIHAKSLKVTPEATSLSSEEKFIEKKNKRKSLELHFDVSKIRKSKFGSSWLKACTSNTLGVVTYTAAPELQTTAFHKLKLQDLISSDEKLESIKIPLKKSEFFIGFKTLLDNSFENDELFSSKSDKDVSFYQLLKYAGNKDQNDLGGSFVNNYPNFEMNQIFCDCFHAEKHSSYTFSVLADGCGLGLKSRVAAQRAVIGATQFINQMLLHPLKLVQTAENMAWVLIQSIAMAHEAIVSVDQLDYNIGTTTLNICFAFITPQGKKYLMVAGLGDCKTFLVTQNSEKQYHVADVSSSKRVNPDPRDPGGRIGPQLLIERKYVNPDLRNLSLVCMPLPEGESIILNMSDGVHDNFTPCSLGVKPCEVDVDLPFSMQWSDLSELDQQALESRFQVDLFSGLINEIMQKDVINLDGICKGLTDHCHQLTSVSRKFMEENPDKQDPEDKKQAPGKMDHCSVVAFRV